MAKKTLSVVIPTFNEADYIKPCLKAVFAQTVLPDEVIVVDNNSTDKTLQIVSKFKGVKVMKEPKQGQVFARKTGFDAARSNWISTLDADSVVDKTWLEDMMSFASADRQAFSSYAYTKEGSFSRVATAVGIFFTFTLNKIISRQELLLGSNFVISKKVWQEVRDDMRMRTDLWEDLDIGLLATRKGYKTALLKKRNVHVSIRGSDVGARNLYKRLEGWPKTYWPYKKTASILAVFIFHIAFVVIMVLHVPVFFHYQIKKNYSGWS